MEMVPQLAFPRVKRSVWVYDRNIDTCCLGGPIRVFESFPAAHQAPIGIMLWAAAVPIESRPGYPRLATLSNWPTPREFSTNSFRQSDALIKREHQQDASCRNGYVLLTVVHESHRVGIDIPAGLEAPE